MLEFLFLPINDQARPRTTVETVGPPMGDGYTAVVAGFRDATGGAAFGALMREPCQCRLFKECTKREAE